MFVLRAALPLLLVCCALGLSACKTGRDQVGTGEPAVLYDRASNYLAGGDFNNAVRFYEALEARYPFAPEARQARLDIMYAYYKSGQVESAVDSAEQFIRENPTHPRVDYAWYIQGLVYFERTPNLIERYPQSDYVHDARRRMIFLRNRLADYEVHVADYYLRRRAYVAALNRARFCIENYDGAPAVRQAVDVMISAYEGMGLTDLAEQSRQVYALNFPGRDPKREPRRWWQFW